MEKIEDLAIRNGIIAIVVKINTAVAIAAIINTNITIVFFIFYCDYFQYQSYHFN